MLTLHAFASPNGVRAALALEECALPYRLEWVDLSSGQHRGAAYLAINPDGTIPALVRDGPDGRSVLTQSGAILRWAVAQAGWPAASDGGEQWFMFAMTDVNPTNSALFAAERTIPAPAGPSVDFFLRRLRDQFARAERRLAVAPFLAGDLSLADLALFPVVDYRQGLLEPGLFPHLLRWHAVLSARPAMQAVRRRLVPP